MKIKITEKVDEEMASKYLKKNVMIIILIRVMAEAQHV